MSGLLFLNSQDFRIEQGQKGNILCNTIKGYSVVLFYSTQCVHCQTLIPIFKNLPQQLPGVQFAMINISVNKNVVLMSRDTIAPISFVPYIIFFFDGKPYMKYSGPYDMNEIKRFVTEVISNLKNKTKFYDNSAVNNNSVPDNKKIPEYAIGIPKCNGDVCYLTYDEAYTAK